MRILLVDDSKLNRKILAKLLGSDKYILHMASGGQEAIDKFNSYVYDLVILDVEMPGLNGYQTAEIIRATMADQNAWIPIIFLSAKNTDDDIARGIAAGGDDYIFKPVSAVVLRSKIFAMERITAMRHKIMNMKKELECANKILEELSAQDSLTKLANRRAFDSVMEQECVRAMRYKTELSLIVLDLDNFKEFNDTYGHQAGDICLEEVSKMMLSVLPRKTDFLARYGGEEFVVILPDTGIMGSKIVADRVCKVISETPISLGDNLVVSTTASLGVYTEENLSNVNAEDIFRRADKALYAAKLGGKNTFLHYSSIQKSN